MEKKYVLYASYGSNTNIEDMSHRCYGAKRVGIGEIKNRELNFRGSGHLTIDKKEGASTPVLIWEILPEHERSLDYYEGFPLYYTKEMIEVTMANGERVACITYIMRDLDMCMPTSSYVETCLKGFIANNLDVNKIREAYKRAEIGEGEGF